MFVMDCLMYIHVFVEGFGNPFLKCELIYISVEYNIETHQLLQCTVFAAEFSFDSGRKLVI